MLRFTTLFNFGLVGLLVAPAALQRGSSATQLENSLDSTKRALQALSSVQDKLAQSDYSAVEGIMLATETPFGGERQRMQLLDELRQDIGQLEAKLQRTRPLAGMEHLNEDPTANMPEAENGSGALASAPTLGLTSEELAEVGNVWPPVPESSGLPNARKSGNRYRFESNGFTVDAVRHGRAYYRAERYQEALRLFQARSGEPKADYWIGRTLERLDRLQEAVASYTKVIDNKDSGPLAQRAEDDREILMWSIDFDRKLGAYKKLGSKRP